MQGDDGVRCHSSMLRIEHQVLDRLLVIQDHLGFQHVLAFGCLAIGDQPLGIQPAVGIAF